MSNQGYASIAQAEHAYRAARIREDLAGRRERARIRRTREERRHNPLAS
ncbi:hypothetical protein [Nocardioides sp.]